jgi:hypothetical protein
MAINDCCLCLEKQRKIDELEDEIDRLKRALGRIKQNEKEGFFGSSTPSSQLPVKANHSTGTKAAQVWTLRPQRVGLQES